MVEVNLNRKRPDPTAKELAGLKDIRGLREIWAIINEQKITETRKNREFISWLNLIADKMDEQDRQTSTEAQFRESAMRFLFYKILGVNGEQYDRLYGSTKTIVIEGIKQQRLIATIKDALPNNATISRLSLSERTFCESMKGIVQEWQNKPKSITAQIEPSAGGSASRHEELGEGEVQRRNALTYDSQGHHFQGETEPRKKFPLEKR